MPYLVRPEDLPREVHTIVVGAGAAGLVIAHRLAEQTDAPVLVLESGTALPAEDTTTPGTAYAALTPDRLHAYMSTPQEGLGGRQVPELTGRILGGGSSVNLLTWFQGHRDDYADWANGAAGWTYDTVVRTFQKLEDYALGGSDTRGAGGPMIISQADDIQPIHLGFLRACLDSGVPATSDLGSCELGAGMVDVNIRDGRRHGVVEGYLAPDTRPQNLRVALGHEVRRVLIEQGRATGVELVDGTRITATDRVILSAGALRTPYLLMQSGIGPAEHLREHGITVIVDSPGVGQNLHNHPMIPVVFPVHTGNTWLDSQDAWSADAYKIARRGPLSSFSTTGALLFLAGEQQAPAIQALIYAVGLGGEGLMDTPAATVLVTLLTPHSRGRVTLGTDGPVIDPGYLSDPSDAARLSQGVAAVRSIMQQPAIRAFCGDTMIGADGLDHPDALEASVRANATGHWHHVGTARMGDDVDAPVDPTDMSVKGVRALHVVDASVMPKITRGNTHAPTVMIAERAAELIFNAAPAGLAANV